MKKIVSLLLSAILFVSTFFSTLIVSAVENTEIPKGKVTELLKEQLAGDIMGEFTKAEDGVLGIPVRLTTFRRESVPSGKTMILYVVGHKEERVGTDTDYDIINDMLNDGYAVTVLDYLDNPKAVGTDFSWSVHGILQSEFTLGKYTGDYEINTGYHYCVPAGCRIATKINYFSLDTMAPYGVNEYILDVYNTYYAGVKTDNNGNLLPTATSVYDCLNKDGTPIYMGLDMDIIYPANPKEDVTVPVMAFASSSETRQNFMTTNDVRPHLTNALLQGYAGIMYDHEYLPMSRTDHFGYFDAHFSLSYYAGNSVHSAAIRRIRYLAETYGYDADYVGVWGFSKGSYGPAILSDPDHEQKGEYETLDEYCPEGKDPTVLPEQPWLYYEGTNERIPSDVTVVYTGAGPGICQRRAFTITENSVPVLTSIGTEDTTGSFYTYIPAVKRDLDALNIESNFMVQQGLGHNPAYAYDSELQNDYFNIGWTWMDNHIKAAYSEEAPEVLWVTPRNDILYDSLEEPFTIKFSRAMDLESVKKNVKVIRVSDGAQMQGEWTTLHGNTTFYFSSPFIINGYDYRLEIPVGTKAADSVGTDVTFVKTVHLSGDEVLSATADTYVSSAEPDANYGEESVLKTTFNAVTDKSYVEFTRENGFSDITKAKLILNRVEDTSGKVNVYGIGSGFDENSITWNNAPTDTAFIGSASVDSDITEIDVTEYVKGATGEELSFMVESSNRNGIVYENDFENADSTNFRRNYEYIWGGDTATMNFVTDAKVGEKAIRVTDRKQSGNRIKFVNSLGTDTLTKDDIGSNYKASFWIRVDEGEPTYNVTVGMYSSSGRTAYSPMEYTVKAGEWAEIEYTVTVTAEMVDENAAYVTVVPYTLNPYNLDEFKVEAEEVSFASKENSEKSSAKLVLYTPFSANRQPTETAVISGANATQFGSIKVDGIADTDVSGSKKGYVKLPITHFNTEAETVTLDFTANATGKTGISVYGLLDDSTKFAESFDGKITWNDAFANDVNGYGVDLQKVYGQKAIATLDTTAQSEFSIDVKDYVKYMSEKGYEAVTFVFVKEGQTISSTLDFEANDTYDAYVASDKLDGFDRGIVADPLDPDNKVFYFEKSGSTAPVNGYYQTLSLTGLIKSNNKFEASDIGTEYTVSFRLYSSVPGSTDRVLKYTSINKADGSSYKTAFEHTVKYNGSSSNSMYANVWTDVEFTFTVTEEMVNNYSDYTAIHMASGSSVKAMYIDDITVTKKSSDINITLSGSDLSGAEVDFEGIDSYTEYTASSHLNGYEIKLVADPEDSNNTVFYFEKSGVNGGTSNSYNQTISFTGLIKKNNVFEASDVGNKYTVKFRQYNYDGNNVGSAGFYGNIAVAGMYGSYSLPSWLKRTVTYGENNTSGNPVNTWLDVTYTFTVTEDMVANYSDATAIVVACGWAATGIYVDDISVSIERTVADEINPDSPRITVTTAENTVCKYYTVASYISGENMDKAVGNVGGSMSVANTKLDSVDGLKKTYLNFEKIKLNHIQGAYLKLKVDNPVSDAVINAYVLTKYFELDSIVWNNAYANYLADNTMNSGFVCTGEAAASVTLSNSTEYILDVTETLIEQEKEDYVTLVLTAGDSTDLIDISSAELNIVTIPYDETAATAEILSPAKNVGKGEQIVASAVTSYSIETSVESAVFYLNGEELTEQVLKGAEVYYCYLDGLEEGDYELYAKFTYADGQSCVSETVEFSVGANNYIKGDVNADGIADIKDLAILKKRVAKLIDDTNPDLVYPDVDGNGEVDVVDLGVLKKIVAGLE